MTRHARFKIPDLPRDRPTARDVRARIVAYYRKPGNEAGGYCHVVLDDGNLGDNSIRYCLGACELEMDTDGFEIMRLMLLLSKTQRRVAIEKWRF